MMDPIQTNVSVRTLKEGYLQKNPVSGTFGSARRRWIVLRAESGNADTYRLQWLKDQKDVNDAKKVRGDLLITRDSKVAMKGYDKLEISTHGRKLVLRPSGKKADNCDAATVNAWKDAVEALVLQLEAAGPSLPGGVSSSSAVRP